MGSKYTTNVSSCKLVLIGILSASLVLIMALSFVNFDSIFGVNFDGQNTGVVFSAYVKQSSEPIPNGWANYSLENVKTMLEVISGKFSRVATYGVGADIVPYVKNSTYYSSFGQVYSAEAAAMINKERGESSLTLLVGIWQSDNPLQMETEIRVALESAAKANEIYPGTVEGLIFSQSDIFNNVKRAQQTLNNIRRIQNEADQLGLRIGSRQICNGITTTNETDETTSSALDTARRDIINESDFMICEVYPFKNYVDPETAYHVFRNELIRHRHELRKINPNIEVMGQTGWPSSGKNVWENTDNMKIFWELANKFAVGHKFTVWFMEAFDNPWKQWKPNEAHMGWWKLRNNSDVGLEEGYIEKISSGN